MQEENNVNGYTSKFDYSDVPLHRGTSSEKLYHTINVINIYHRNF